MEPLILYFVLFFPGIFASPFRGGASPGGPVLPQQITFSIVQELGRTLTYTLPSLALLWYIISDKRGFSALETEKPRKQDLLPFAAGLPGLIIIGVGVSFLVSQFSGITALVPPPMVEAPGSIPGWIVMVLSCLGTGYLEESYFRYYLLTWLERYIDKTVFKILFSTALFSLCHIYEGPWGILNAILAGVLLSLLFIRYRSLHGIAWAHGAYNIFVYAMGKL